MSEETTPTAVQDPPADPTPQDPTPPPSSSATTPGDPPASNDPPAAGDPPANADKGESSPPEKYDLTAPEGSAMSSALLDKTAATARELGLSNEEAQGLVDMQAQAIEAYVAEQQAAFEAQQKDWIETAKSDPEIGGDKFAESAEMAKRGLEKWASPALKAMITDSGFGNHPEILRLFAKLGRHGENDQPPGTPPGNATLTDEERAKKFYESMRVA